ncbi:Very-long-chain 3-oxoacyl-CoA reductase-like protein [Elsinoe fawcettii]|nr:Very-long-chain 3-oxoacyl-CoA reductase-like protein [Elsinoe fawcettii]
MDRLQSMDLSFLNRIPQIDIPPRYIKLLAATGGLWAVSQLYKLSSFSWYHFLRPYNLSKYKSGGKGEPWALVTGSSDGIGLGFAEELASQGFNVILHGRNKDKLEKVKDQLRSQWPSRKFDILILDAQQDAGNTDKMASALSKFKDINIKILINNVGGVAGAKPTFRSFSEQPPEVIDAWIDVNLRFATQFTRQLLPTLIANQPALIINISSGAADAPSPWIAVYSGAKAFNKSWSRSLAVELLDEGHDIDCHAIVVGPTATSRLGFATGFTTPSPRTMARASLGYAGTGVRDVAAHWGHEYLMSVFSIMPGWYAENFIRKLSKEMAEKEKKDIEQEARAQKS